MRKSAIAVGIGAFLFTLGLLFKFYAYPKLAVVPVDQNTRAIVAGPNSKVLDVSSLGKDPKNAVKSGTITTTVTVVGVKDEAAKSQQNADPYGPPVAMSTEECQKQPGMGNAMVMKYGQTSHLDGTPPDQLLEGGNQIYVFDRTTGLAMKGCGASTIQSDPATGKKSVVEIDRDGLLFKFPFNTEKKDYPFWDAKTAKAWPAKFVAEEQVEGVKAYKFEQTVEPTVYQQLSVPGEFYDGGGKGAVKSDRTFADKRTWWVEPETGVVLKRIEQQRETLTATEGAVKGQEKVVLETTSQDTPESVKAGVDEFGKKGQQLGLVRSLLPWLLMALGLLAIVGGLLLGARSGRRRNDEPRDAAYAGGNDAGYHDGYDDGLDPEVAETRRTGSSASYKAPEA